jgi:hypothetical protein
MDFLSITFKLKKMAGKYWLRTGMALVLLCTLAVVSCKKKKEVAPTATQEVNEPAAAVVDLGFNPNDTLLYYDKGACFGMCPIFTFVMYADGRAIYNGKNNVNRIGIYQTKVNDAALQKVIATAEKIGYFSFQDVYDNPSVTDLPTIKTGVAVDGKLKKVASRYKGPQGLKLLYEEMDALIEAQNWVQGKANN